MKKNRLLAALLAAGMLLGLAACASAPAASEASEAPQASQASQAEGGAVAQEDSTPAPEAVSYDGVWQTEKVTQDGEEISGDALDQLGGRSTLTLYPDGSLTLKNDNVSRTGAWSKKDGGVQIDSEGYSVEAKLTGDKLVMDSKEDGVVMTFARTGDAPEKSGTASTDGDKAADSDSIAGTWEITAGKEDGASLTREETIEALGADMRLEIRADGTFTAVAMADGKETNSTEGEWSQEGNSFILLANGETETFELSGSTLIAEDGGVTLMFEKK